MALYGNEFNGACTDIIFFNDTTGTSQLKENYFGHPAGSYVLTTFHEDGNLDHFVLDVEVVSAMRTREYTEQKAEPRKNRHLLKFVEKIWVA